MPYMFYLVLAACAVMSLHAQIPETSPAFPNSLTGTPGTLLFRQVGESRITNIAYHNGSIYTHLVGGGNQLRWAFTDIDDPASFAIQEVGVGNFADTGNHGHFKVGDWLGGQFGVSIRRQSTGVNVQQNMPGFTYLNPNVLAAPGDNISRMYYPWGTPFNWIEYGASVGNGYLFRGAEQLIEWPALAQHGVAGNSILLGNLLFITSDESNMGVLCYDISPVFDTPAAAPLLLDKLVGPVGAYIAVVWENYLVFSRRDTDTVDIVDFSDPGNLQFVTSIDVSGDAGQDLGNGLGYVQCQDNFVFADRHKIDMDTFQVVLELDEIGDNRPAGSVPGQLDISQYMMPMGNLLVTGAYSHAGADGIGVWIHDAQPDTNPPYVGYHVPRPGQTDFPLGAPVSLIIHENLESYTIVNGESVILRPVGGDPVDATVSFSHDDVLTITPVAYLEEDTTYEVEVVAGGIKDVSGNGILPYLFSFSTGAGVEGGNGSPVVSSFGATPSPAPPETLITFSAVATDADLDALEYRFTFGDAGEVRDWDPSPSAQHSYPGVGHFGVKVQVRDIRDGVPLSSVSQTGTVSVVAAPPAVDASKSSPIALDAAGRRVWVVNPDNDSVSVIDADTRTLVSEFDLAALLSVSGSVDPRSVAIDAAGNAWVTCRDASRLAVLDPAGGLLADIDLGYGSAPMGVAIAPDGAAAFVTLEGRDALLRFDTATWEQTGSLSLGPMPRAIAITADGARVLVTRFISAEEYGEIWEVDAAAMTLTRRIPLHRDRGRDGSSAGRGVPNYVSSVTISPLGDYAYYTAVKANTQRGLFFDLGEGSNQPLDPDNTVRAMVGRIDLFSNEEPFVDSLDTYRIDVDNSDSPTGVAFTPSGDYLFVSIQGNNHIAVFDDLLIRSLPRSVSVKTTKGRFATGLAPQGLVFDPVGNTLFSADFMGRSVTAHQMAPFLSFGLRTTNRVAITTIDVENLASDVLLGKQVFYQADDGSGLSDLPQVSQEGYISCASCHADGQHDGMTWDFTQRGEGLRNTTDLRGRAGTAHGNVHWSGNFDEIQDFILDITNQFGGGAGFLPEGETPNPPLGAPNAGRSAELDALAAYVASLGAESLPGSPHRNPYGTRTAAAVAGEAVFVGQGCASCHGGAGFTDSALGVAALHDVGTLRTSSGGRLGGTLPGIDTPTLFGVWATAPYFHDGSAKTLDEVFRVAGGTVLQAEAAILGAGVTVPGYPQLNEDSSIHGQMVYLDAGETVTFENVDGGAGGEGDLELRWTVSRYGTTGITTVTVNGVVHEVAVSRPLGPGQPSNHWQRLRIEDVELSAGAGNTIVVSTDANTCGFDDLTVTTADDRAAAAAHRVALELGAEDYENLIQYVLQLDGSGNEPPANPTVVISSLGTSPSDHPVAEFDIVFSEPVSGFDIGDLDIGGTAGVGASALFVIGDGLHYRLRVAGFSQSGTVTVAMPAGRVAAVDDGLPNFVAESAAWSFVRADDLALLSDEFDGSGTLADWQRNDEQEGWGADKLEVWDIDTSRPGHMRVMPFASSWYADWTGALVFKEVSGDFVATMRFEANRRDGLPGRPQAAYSLGGIMMRAPRLYQNAAPVPDPAPGVELSWPPPPEGDPGYYTSPWTTGTENYLFLSFGNADTVWGNIADTWYCEVKSTTDSVSNLYAVQSGIPADEGLVTLQAVRMGSTFLLLRRHGEGPWIVENRFVRPDLPQVLQVGVTTYTDWDSVVGVDPFHHNHSVIAGGSPDLVVDVDYFRLHRPVAALTPEMLDAVQTTGQYGQPSLLAATALAPLLGEAAAAASDGQTYGGWLEQNFSLEQLLDPEVAAPESDPDQNGMANLIDFLTDGDPHGGDPAFQFSIAQIGDITEMTLGRNTLARGGRLIIEVSDDLENWEILAESVDGAVPSGPGFVGETPGVLRVMTVHDTASAATARRFFKVRAVGG